MQPVLEIADLDTIIAVDQDVKRLSPISSIGKVLTKLAKEDDVSSLILEHDEQDNAVLSPNLISRFRSLLQWKGWIKVKPTKDIPSSSESYEPMDDNPI